MQTTPAVKVTRFAQLNSGELFIFRHDGGSCVALVAEDPTENGEKLVLPIGPILPQRMSWPTLFRPGGMTVISYGKDYTLRLSAQADGWLDSPPPPEQRCVVVADQRVYFRANFNSQPGRFQDCYVDIDSGLICASGTGAFDKFSTPKGILAFAIRWEFATVESEPRSILVYP